MGEVGPGACAGFLVGKTGVCPLVGTAESCPSDGQDHVKDCLEVAVGSGWLQAACLQKGANTGALCDDLSAIGPETTWSNGPAA